MGECMNIRAATVDDSQAIAAIYNHYIKHSIATFEHLVINANQINERLNKVQAANLSWLVVEEGGEILGYAYACPWRERFAYRFSVEVTVYLKPQASGRGLGHLLYQQLFTLLADKNIHAIMAGISLPNEASAKLHEKMGMKKVAHFSEVGYKFDQWIDVGYWQKVL